MQQRLIQIKYFVDERRQGEGNKEEIRVKTEVQIYMNQRDAEVEKANAELAKKKTVLSRSAKVAHVEVNKTVLIRETTLHMKVAIQMRYVKNQMS